MAKQSATSASGQAATEVFDRAAATAVETSADARLSTYKVGTPGNEFDGHIVEQQRGTPKES